MKTLIQSQPQARPYGAWLVVLAAGLLWLPLTVIAQADPPERRTETEAETIGKCLRELESPDAEIRRRAVLILGKYDNPRARAGLVQSLTDSEAGIRRSALMAMINQPVFGEEVLAMLKLVGDADDSTRRIVTSHLPRLLMSWQRVGMRFEVDKQLPPEIRKPILAAFDDKDATVRKNMVDSWRSLAADVFAEPELVLSRLKDEERDVRILALQAAPTLLGTKGFVARTENLADDPDQKIRLLLTRFLAGNRFTDRLRVLGKLSQDEDFEVSTEAWIGLFTAGTTNAWQELRRRLDDARLKSDQASRIIAAVPVLQDEGRKILQDLMADERAAYRLDALKAYAGSYWRAVDRDLLLKLMDDPSAEVRKTAAALLTREQDLPPAAIAALAKSKHEESRSLALALSNRLPKDQAADILMELMLDDHAGIRRNALIAIAERQVAGWQEILTDALGDDDLDVRRIAVAGLAQFGGDKERKTLNGYLENGKDEKLKEFIRYQLEQQSSPSTPRRP